MMGSLTAPWPALHAFSSPCFDFSKHCVNPSPSHSHSLLVRSCRSPSNDLPFVLHDALDASGTETCHARAAREGFCSEIKRLSGIERETSISINRGVDLGKTALCIAAEDDSLISHSSVPLPVDAFIERLDDLSMSFCSHNSSSFRLSPENFLQSLERFLYVHKAFRRSNVKNHSESRALYLHSVLTHRTGSAAMLSVIYAEILKMIRLWGLLNFDAEIYFPRDRDGVPRGYHKQKSKASDQPHIMTTESLLVEILRNLKEAFWPFQYDHSRSLFLRAANAANCIDKPHVVEERLSGFELASSKAAQHRLERGVWTSAQLGDMRRALSACERLILLDFDWKELRDYGILLYHCGFYEESLKYLKLYQTSRNSLQKEDSNKFSDVEEDAVEKLITRLNLILMEKGWTTPSYVRSFLSNNSEPW